MYAVTKTITFGKLEEIFNWLLENTTDEWKTVPIVDPIPFYSIQEGSKNFWKDFMKTPRFKRWKHNQSDVSICVEFVNKKDALQFKLIM